MFTETGKPPAKYPQETEGMSSAAREPLCFWLRASNGVIHGGSGEFFHVRKICLTFLKARCHDALQI